MFIYSCDALNNIFYNSVLHYQVERFGGYLVVLFAELMSQNVMLTHTL